MREWLLTAGNAGPFFPAFFVAVVVEDEGGDMALRIALKRETGNAGAVGIKEDRGRFGGNLIDFAHAVFLVKKIALAEDGDHDIVRLYRYIRRREYQVVPEPT